MKQTKNCSFFFLFCRDTQNVKSCSVIDLLLSDNRDGGTYFQVGRGMTRDLKWKAEETLLLVSLYFSGGKAHQPPG